MALLWFGLALVGIAIVTFLPAIIRAERAAPRLRTGPTAIDVAVDSMLRAQGDAIVAEMEIADIRQLQAENDELIAQHKRHADSAVKTTRGDAQAWAKRRTAEVRA